jgi:hypothetical protein
MGVVKEKKRLELIIILEILLFALVLHIIDLLRLKLFLGIILKPKHELGWEPEITFSQLVEDMCENE